MLRISIGVIYLWFGALKFFPQLSPAEMLAKDTIRLITFGLLPDNTSIILLALWETLLGVLLILGWWWKPVFVLLMIHLLCTFLPLFFFEQVSFTTAPYAFTLVGQYIVKNAILISAVLVLNEFYSGKIGLVGK
jgi:uncharacterized membrane protein YphA (DoxX/SURF4 family)